MRGEEPEVARSSQRLASGAEVVAEILERASGTTVFALRSEQARLLAGALGRRGIRVVDAWTSAGAVAMADAYARVSGQLGVALTPSGAAAADAAGALREAAAQGSRLLHLVGEVPSSVAADGRAGVDDDRFDQPGLLRAVASSTMRVSSGERLASVVVEAIAVAAGTPGGAASVELPTGVIAGAARPWRALPLPIRRPPSPSPSELEAAIALVVSARHPLVWSGGGPVSAGAFAEMRTLVETLGAGLITSSAGRSVLREDHPLVIGNFSSHSAVLDLLACSDVLVLVGCRLRSLERSQGLPELPPVIVQIDVDAGAIGRHCDPTLAIVADARQTLDGLSGGISALGREGACEPGWSEQVAKAAAAARGGAAGALGPFAAIPRLLREAFPAEAVVVEDVPRLRRSWDSRLLAVLRPRGFLRAPSGSPGRGVAMAAGAALAAKGDEVLAVVAEQSLFAGAGEMARVADEAMAVRFVVLADGVRRRLAALPSGLDDAPATESLGAAELASAYGIWSRRVGSLSALPEALYRARSVDGPSLVELDLRALA